MHHILSPCSLSIEVMMKVMMYHLIQPSHLWNYPLSTCKTKVYSSNRVPCKRREVPTAFRDTASDFEGSDLVKSTGTWDYLYEVIFFCDLVDAIKNIYMFRGYERSGSLPDVCDSALTGTATVLNRRVAYHHVLHLYVPSLMPYKNSFSEHTVS